MYRNVKWLEPWDSLCTNGISFEQELYKEVGINHVLYRKTVIAIGRRYDRDEFLFQVNNSEFKIAVVHLTFLGKRQTDSNYPKTKLYTDFNDWINNCMISDHIEFE